MNCLSDIETQGYCGGFELANHKSAAKRARQTVRKTEVNNSRCKSVRTFEKKLRSAIANKEGDQAQALLKTFSSKIDKAAKTGVITRQTASRKISRLSSQVHQIVSGQ